MTTRTLRHILTLATMLMLTTFIGCGADAGAAGTPVGSEPISTVSPSVTVTANQILSAARGTLLNAQSFEITKTTTRIRDDGSHSDEITARVADDVSAYVHDLHGRQITEVLAVPGRRYVRYSFVGQDVVKWEEDDWSEVQSARRLNRELSDLESPRLVGTRERNGVTLYVLEGTAPEPITFGGPGIWAEIEPGTYTLEVDAESLEPVRLVYTYVTTLVHDGTPSPDPSDTTVTVEFASVNDPVAITPPPGDEILRPDDATPTPAPRYPQWPTPPTH